MSRHSWSIVACLLGVLSMPALCSSATILRCGETSPQWIIDKFDSLTFEAAAQEVVSITVAAEPDQEPNFAPEFQLEGPDGDSVFFTGADRPRVCESFDHQCETEPLPQTGTYTIVVNDNGKKQKGRYFITLEAVSATANGQSNGPSGEGPTCRRTNDAGRADGTQPIVPEVPVGGTVDVQGETDTFTFVAGADQTIEFQLDLAAASDSLFDPRWQLFDPQGQPVGDDTCNVGTPCARGPLAAAGVYTVKVFDEGYDGVGDYTLVLRNPDAPSTTTTTTSVTTSTSDPSATTTTLPSVGGDKLYELSRILRPSVSEELGAAIAADATRLVIGVPFDQTGLDRTTPSNTGTVYVMSLIDFPQDTYGVFARAPLKKPGGGARKDRFGAAVAITPDAIAVGAPGADVVPPGGPVPDAGAVYLFGAGDDPGDPLLAPQPVEDSLFGATLTVGGGNLFVGAPSDGSSRAGRVYRFEGRVLKQVYGDTTSDPTLAAVGGPGAGANFGAAIATFQDQTRNLVAIGAPGDGTREGRVFVYDANAGTWRVLRSPSGAPGDDFGRALTYVDSTLIIGAPRASKVFRQSGSEPATLLLERGDLADFGAALAPFPGGFLVGAPGAGPLPDAGLVLGVELAGGIREYSKVRPQGGDRYGASLAVAGDRVFVGATGDDSGNVDSGAVYVYPLNVAVELAVFRKRVTDTAFGSSIVADDETIAVGAPLEEEGQGAVYSYDAQDTPCLGGVCPSRNRAVGAAPGSRFGQAVGLVDGVTLVGAPFDKDRTTEIDVGAAYLVTLGRANVEKVLIPNPEAEPLAGDQFGLSVAAIEDDFLVGAPMRGATDTGAVFVFDKRTQRRRLTLTNPVPTTGDFFGAAVAGEGDTVVVGAPFDSSANPKAGAAYLFRRSTAELLEGKPLVSPVGGAEELFGAAVAMSAEYIVVGAPSENPAEAGRAYVFDRTSRQLLRIVDDPNLGGAGDRFGAAVAIVGGRILVGAPFADGAASPDTGAAYLIDPATGGVAQRFENPEQGVSDLFGSALAPTPSGLAIGATGPGRVYVYGSATASQTGALTGSAVARVLADLVVSNAYAAGDAIADSGCGDGNVDATEECDDGNDIDTDSCSNACKISCCIIDPRAADRCNDYDPCTADSVDPATNTCLNVDTGQCCTSDDSCAGQGQTCRICAGCSLFPWDCCDQGATCLLSSEECQGKDCFEKPSCECQGGLTCGDADATPTAAMSAQFEQACEALRLEGAVENPENPVAAGRGAAKEARRALKAARRETKHGYKKGAFSKDCRKQYLDTIRLVRASIPSGNRLRRCVAEPAAN